MKTRLLITGATGFTGTYLIKALTKNPAYDVSIIIRETSDISNIKDTLNKIKIHTIDSSFDDIYQIIPKAKPDIVIHLAATYPRTESKKDIEQMLNSNIIFGAKLLNGMAHNNVNSFLNTGTPMEYLNGPPEYNPASFYSASKRALQDLLEYYIKAHDFKTITLLPYNTYGPGDRRNNLFSLLKNCLLNKIEIKLTAGEQFMDLLYIEDLVEAYIKTLDYLLKKKSLEHEKIFIGSGKAVTLKGIVHLYKKISGQNMPVIFGGIPYRKRECMFAQGNIAEAQKKLKWKPKHSLIEGIKKTLKKEKIIK